MKTIQKRRDFLKISAAGTIGVMALGSSAMASVAAKKKVDVGLQLYTIRDAIAADLK